MASISREKSFSALTITSLFISIFGILISQQGIENVSYGLVGVGFFIVSLVSYKFSVFAFFFLGFFRNFFKYKLFGIFALHPLNIISIALIIHFFRMGLLTKKGLLDTKFIVFFTLCLILNLIFVLRHSYEFQLPFYDSDNSLSTLSFLTAYIIFPIQYLFFLNKIFSNIKDENDLEKLKMIIVSLAIIAASYLCFIFFSQSSNYKLLMWSNPLIGHKNSYGPFYVMIFFYCFHLYRVEDKNKMFYLSGLISSLIIIAISLSRNAYFSLLIAFSILSLFRIIDIRNLFIGIFLGILLLFVLPEEVVIDRAFSSFNAVVNLNVEGFKETSSGHFTDESFNDIGVWISEHPLIGGSFKNYNRTESGWIDIFKNQGLIGLTVYLMLVMFLHRFFRSNMFSKDKFIKKYAFIGFQIMIVFYFVNISSLSLILTKLDTPILFLVASVYLAINWKKRQLQNFSKTSNYSEKNPKVNINLRHY